jgi:hypothetical protein
MLELQRRVAEAWTPPPDAPSGDALFDIGIEVLFRSVHVLPLRHYFFFVALRFAQYAFMRRLTARRAAGLIALLALSGPR